jgi:UDP-glucose 4-epimerase
MAILVTGGAGYIGSVMVETLRERGFEVAVLDNLSRGHRAAVPPDVPLLVGDTGDTRFLDGVFAARSYEAVFHFAASSQVGESMRDPGAYFLNNVCGLAVLVEAMVRHGARRFILSSTAATYGDPPEVPIPEDAPARPTNPYGESKLICERMLEWFGRIHGLRWSALRYFNAAGASVLRGEDHLPETHLIPLALRAASTGEALEVFGTDYPTPDGTCVRDYIHVQDLAEAHLLALQAMEKGPGGIFNLGNGQGFSVLEVIGAVERISGRRVPWHPAARRAGDPPRLVAASAKAVRELGWRPARNQLETIVESAWRWMESHPHGYTAA